MKKKHDEATQNFLDRMESQEPIQDLTEEEKKRGEERRKRIHELAVKKLREEGYDV